MIFNITLWITGFFLLLMAIMDVKTKRIPSIFSTTAILLLAIINVLVAPQNIFFGVIGFIFAWLLFEFGFIKGIADIKGIIIIAFTLTTISQFIAFMLLVPLFNLVYQISLKKFMKNKKLYEIPFIPVLFFVFITLRILIYII